MLHTNRWPFAALVAAAALTSLTPAFGKTQGGAAAAFETLKGLAGTWTGTYSGGDASGELSVEYKVTSAGTAVMETLFAGTPHEMVNVYHRDGDRLMVTHYCAGGTQPHMVLDPASSSASRLHFTFAGGTNLDPEKDDHMHETTLAVGPDGSVESEWANYHAGKPAGSARFALRRQ